MTGHEGIVHSVAFSPDGQRIVSGGADGTIRLWDARTQEPIGPPVAVGSDVNAVAYHPDGRRVVSGDMAGNVRILDPSTGTPGDVIASNQLPVLAVALSADGRRIIASGMQPAIKMWTSKLTHQCGRPPHSAAVTSLAFSPDGKRIASSSQDGTVRIWNADNQRSGGHQVVGPGRQWRNAVRQERRDRARQPSHGAATTTARARSSTPIAVNRSETDGVTGGINFTNSARRSPDRVGGRRQHRSAVERRHR
jgi:WD40 repeat protein